MLKAWGLMAAIDSSAVEEIIVRKEEEEKKKKKETGSPTPLEGRKGRRRMRSKSVHHLSLSLLPHPTSG